MKRGRPRKKPIEVDSAEYWNHARPIPKEPLQVEICGRVFQSENVERKTSCADCDIFKMRKLNNQSEYPLCYEYCLGNHYVVDFCRGHQMIWKRK